MIFFDKHRRARKNLSAYIDGELSGREHEQVEAHLASCEACSTEFAQMRATIDALSALPEQAPRRSFQLTPDMVTAPRERVISAPSAGLANGMRMAAAGIAAALIVVFIVDVGESGTGGDDDTGALSERAVTEHAYDDAQAPDYAADGDSLSDDSDDAGADGVGSEGGLDTGSGTSSLPLNSEDRDVAEDSGGGDSDGEADRTTDDSAEPDEPADAPPADSPADDGDAAAEDLTTGPDDDDGGIGTLAAIEIGLGVALAITVAAAVWLTLASRSRDQRI